MEPITFEKEWEKVSQILGEKSHKGDYSLSETAVKLMCEGMYKAGKIEGMDYMISKLKQ